MTETKEQAVQRFAKLFNAWCVENEEDNTSLENVRRWSGMTFGRVPEDRVCRKIVDAVSEL